MQGLFSLLFYFKPKNVYVIIPTLEALNDHMEIQDSLAGCLDAGF
jgi:hypothetical protein